MAFLDNSGDIILDAVLTDTGRLRMAQGDGSFKITKFALGDDEINYGLYNKDHLSGSAYYDLEVLQTPVLEAFTNNTSNLKSKLVTMSRTNVLYMPILKMNANSSELAVQNGFQSRNSATFKRTAKTSGTDAENGTAVTTTVNKHYVAVDSTTFDGIYKYRKDATWSDDGDHLLHSEKSGTRTQGVIQGYDAGDASSGNIIRIDHGLDTEEISVAQGIDSDLQENAFIVELDYRLGRLKGPVLETPRSVNFIDDDSIATYYVTGTPYVRTTSGEKAPIATNTFPPGNGIGKLNNLPSENPQVFGNGKGNGPRGSTIHFRIEASAELKQSTYLFKQLGQVQDLTVGAGYGANSIAGLPQAGSSSDPFLNNLTEKKLYYIDSTVRVIGANTGYRLDIPIRYVKLV